MFFQKSRVLVTGGSGLVGTAIVRELVALGANVRATWRNRRPTQHLPGVEYVQCDLLRREDCDAITAGIDYAFLCAANTSGAATMERTPLVHVTPNIIANAQILEAAYFNKVKKTLWLSSTTGYPDLGGKPLREDEMFHGDPYDKYFPVGWMKRYTEVLCRMYSEKLNPSMPCLVLRPTNIYGPGDKFDPEKSHVLPALIRKVVERQTPLEVWGTGEDIRDFIYVDDMVEAMLAAMEKLAGYDPINIGSGLTYSVRELLDLILEIEQFHPDVNFDRSKPTMIPARAVEVGKAQRLLGFSARTDLRAGIRKTIEWYKGTQASLSN